MDNSSQNQFPTVQPVKPVISEPPFPKDASSESTTPYIPPVPGSTPPPPPPPPPPPVQPPPSVQPPPPMPGSTPPSPGTNLTPPPGRRISTKILLIIILVIIAILGIGVLLLYFLPKLSLSPLKQEKSLTWWGLWEDESIVQPLIDEYQSQNPNIKIDYVSQSKEDYRERLVNSLAQGKGPDIFRFHNSWVPMLSSNLSVIPDDVYTQQEFTTTFYPVATADLKTASGFVGIPLEYDGLGLFINEDIFSTYGENPPKTWNELLETASKLTIRDKNGIIQQSGIAMGSTNNVDHWPEILALMLIQNSADLENPANEAKIDLASNALDYYASFNTRYGIWDETLPNSTVFFAGGKLAMMFAPSWRVFEVLAQNPSLKFRVVAVPQVPKESDLSIPDVTYATYWVEGVAKSSPNQKDAWEFLKFLSQKESLEKLYFNASQIRRFGEPYPRPDMADLILSEPYVGGFLSLAPSAKSWYLASRTWDGATGINSKITKYYEDAVNAAISGRGSTEKALMTASTGIQQELSVYGLVAPPPVLSE